MISRTTNPSRLPSPQSFPSPPLLAARQRTLDDGSDGEVDNGAVDDGLLMRSHQPVALLVHVKELNLRGQSGA